MQRAEERGTSMMERVAKRVRTAAIAVGLATVAMAVTAPSASAAPGFTLGGSCKGNSPGVRTYDETLRTWLTCRAAPNYVSVPANHVGWVTLAVGSSSYGQIRADGYAIGYRSTGFGWQAVSVPSGWVYHYPYSGSWRWLWTQQTGWVAYDASQDTGGVSYSTSPMGVPVRRLMHTVGTTNRWVL